MSRLVAEQRIKQFLDRVNPNRRRRDRAFRELRQRFYRDLWAKTAARLSGSLVELADGFLQINVGRRHTFVRFGDVMLDSYVLWELAGNKPLCHKLLEQVPGYRMASYATYSLKDLEPAYAFLEQSESAVVIKPASGPGAGRGVTTGIRDPRLLRQASVHAARFGSSLMIEEQIAGSSFRLLFLNGRLLHAIRRDPPTVRGDGQKSIALLMEEETTRRLSASQVSALSPLEIDLEAKQTLREQGLAVVDRPERDRVLMVKRVANQNSNRENHVVTDQVHPSYLELGCAIADALSIELMGLDVLAPDLERPLGDSGGVIGEVNTTPGLHHHYLVAEPASNGDVAEQVLRYVLDGCLPHSSERLSASA